MIIPQLVFIGLLISTVIFGGIVLLILKKRNVKGNGGVLFSWVVLALILSGHAARCYGVRANSIWSWLALVVFLGIIVYHARNNGLLRISSK